MLPTPEGSHALRLVHVRRNVERRCDHVVGWMIRTWSQLGSKGRLELGSTPGWCRWAGGTGRKAAKGPVPSVARSLYPEPGRVDDVGGPVLSTWKGGVLSLLLDPGNVCWRPEAQTSCASTFHMACARRKEAAGKKSIDGVFSE